jgi:hypothetical protein
MAMPRQRVCKVAGFFIWSIKTARSSINKARWSILAFLSAFMCYLCKVNKTKRKKKKQ